MSTASPSGLRALCGSLLAITTVVIALRFYARRVQRAVLGADDWMIIPSYLGFVGMVTCALIGVNLRYFGYTDKEVAATNLSFSTEASLVVSLDILSAASLGCIRISALLFFRRIFCVPGCRPFLRATIYGIIIVVSLWMAAFIILPPLQCGPDLSVWSASAAVRAAKCTLGSKIILGFCISDLILEVLVIGLPVPLVLRLNVSLRRRLAVLFVFLTAFVSLGAVIARLAITTQILQKQVRDKSETNTTQTFMWILEVGFALIAVNLPTLWWLKKKVPTENVLASLRSALSLHSLRSRSSRQSKSETAFTAPDTKDVKRTSSSAEQFDFASYKEPDGSYQHGHEME